MSRDSTHVSNDDSNNNNNLNNDSNSDEATNAVAEANVSEPSSTVAGSGTSDDAVVASSTLPSATLGTVAAVDDQKSSDA